MLFLLCPKFSKAQNPELWYKRPAVTWEEALPIGNGHIGAMIYGGTGREHIQFNEETLWTGEPRSYVRKEAARYLPQIRQHLEQGRQTEAEALAEAQFISDPKRQMSYQPFGDIFLTFPGHEEVLNYRRNLDLKNAVASVSYQINDVSYLRRVFASNPAKTIYYSIKASKKQALNFTIETNTLHSISQTSINKQEIMLHVKVKDGILEGTARIKIKTDGKVTRESDRLIIKNATVATLMLTAATNFISYDHIGQDPGAITATLLKNAPDFEKALLQHTADYQTLYNRFSIQLPKVAASALPTDERLRHFELAPNDPDLLALFVQYARYLLISSSRPGSQPATLQGIWNNSLQPPWDSKWTLNINTEMNYWPAELTNLAECHEPLFQMIAEFANTGKDVAQAYYQAPGWVVHHNTDLWRGAAPVNAAEHGIWPTGGAWLAMHLWERYLFSADLAFLQHTAYPLMKGAALFFESFLVKDPTTGWLISTPSNAPEHGGLVAGPTMDHQMIRSLFKACISAGEILKTDAEFISTLREMTNQIAPDQAGKYGQLQEWMVDQDDTTNNHRHISHLWGVYPGAEITPVSPQLFDAAQKSLLSRGDGGTGWSIAWKINLWARFLEGNRAYQLIRELLRPVSNINQKETAGVYPNLWSAHPPFQIDGNLGGAAGILELLIQSHAEEIHLLPALPSPLTDGKISGIKARSGFELSFSWEDNRVKDIIVFSVAGKECKIRYGNKTVKFPTKNGTKYYLNADLDLQMNP